jgi:hypothetical protein
MNNTMEQKVDRLVHLLEGDGSDAPGIVARLGMLERILYGNASNGLVHRVNVLWRVHTWVLCSASGVLGWMACALWGYARAKGII